MSDPRQIEGHQASMVNDDRLRMRLINLADIMSDRRLGRIRLLGCSAGIRNTRPSDSERHW